jgi:hypothetical protein
MLVDIATSLPLKGRAVPAALPNMMPNDKELARTLALPP